MEQIPPFRNRRDVFYLVHEEPTKESKNGIYIVKPKDNSYRAIWAVVWDVPLKLMSTSDGYTKEEVDKIISTIRTELANVVAGLVPMGSVYHLTELETKPKRNNDAYYVEDQRSPEGSAYIYRWDAGLNLWVNTKQVVFKDEIAQLLADVEDIYDRIVELELHKNPMVVMTENEYDALEIKDPDTYYLIIED